MIGALLYLRLHSLKNRVVRRLRRLRQPKYLVGAIVGLLYFYGAFFRGPLPGPGRPDVAATGFGALPAEARALVELAIAALLLVLVLRFWVFPSPRAALEFDESEIQFLFPAPVTRRGLIHYKLLSWQLGLLFTSVILSLFSGRLTRGHGAWMAVLGWWVALFLVQLHALGASFARARLAARTGSDRALRFAVVIGAVALPLAAGAWAVRAAPPWPGLADAEPAEAGRWLLAVAGTAPLAWLLAPLRWVARLAVAREGPEFLAALGLTLGLVVLHYRWVLRADVAFEEAAVDAARAAAERKATLQTGRLPRDSASRRRRRSVPFELRPIGPAWLALTWKNLIAAGAVFRARTLIRVLSLVLPVLVVASSLAGRMSGVGVIAAIATVLYGISVIAGPGVLRYDLRHDLPGATDVLKALPLPGRQIVLGEILAPGLILAVTQILLALVVALLVPQGIMGDSGVGALRRVALFLTGALVGPALTGVSLSLQNVAVLLFPAWVLPGPQQIRGGFEAVGQLIIVAVGQMLLFLLALIPPALLGGATFAAGAWAFGRWAALVPAATVTTIALLAEGAVLIGLLGRLWDRTDLSGEQAA